MHLDLDLELGLELWLTNLDLRTGTHGLEGKDWNLETWIWISRKGIIDLEWWIWVINYGIRTLAWIWELGLWLIDLDLWIQIMDLNRDFWASIYEIWIFELRLGDWDVKTFMNLDDELGFGPLRFMNLDFDLYWFACMDSDHGFEFGFLGIDLWTWMERLRLKDLDPWIWMANLDLDWRMNSWRRTLTYWFALIDSDHRLEFRFLDTLLWTLTYGLGCRDWDLKPWIHESGWWIWIWTYAWTRERGLWLIDLHLWTRIIDLNSDFWASTYELKHMDQDSWTQTYKFGPKVLDS